MQDFHVHCREKCALVILHFSKASSNKFLPLPLKPTGKLIFLSMMGLGRKTDPPPNAKM